MVSSEVAMESESSASMIPAFVESNIEPPVGLLRGLHRRGHLGIVGHVGLDRGGLAPGCSDQLDGLVVGRNEVDRNDPGAFFWRSAAAVARPIPPAVPVMSATLPSSLIPAPFNGVRNDPRYI